MKSVLIPVGSCVFGLTIGLFSGWIVWGKKSHVATASQPAAETGTSPTLDKATAEKLILAQMDQKTICGWYGPTRATNTTWTFMDSDDRVPCARALQEVGLAKLGDCMDTIGGKCFKRVISAVAEQQAELNEMNPVIKKWSPGLYFHCGTTRFIGISSISTNGNTATIKYEREFIPDEPLLKKIEACVIDKPELGRKTRERAAKRDDAGTWSIVSQ